MSRLLKSLQTGEGRGAPMTINPGRTSPTQEDAPPREANLLVPAPEDSAQGAEEAKLVPAFVATDVTEVAPDGMAASAEEYTEPEVAAEPVTLAALPLDHQAVEAGLDVIMASVSEVATDETTDLPLADEPHQVDDTNAYPIGEAPRPDESTHDTDNRLHESNHTSEPNSTDEPNHADASYVADEPREPAEVNHVDATYSVDDPNPIIDEPYCVGASYAADEPQEAAEANHVDATYSVDEPNPIDEPYIADASYAAADAQDADEPCHVEVPYAADGTQRETNHADVPNQANCTEDAAQRDQVAYVSDQPDDNGTTDKTDEPDNCLPETSAATSETAWPDHVQWLADINGTTPVADKTTTTAGTWSAIVVTGPETGDDVAVCADQSPADDTIEPSPPPSTVNGNPAATEYRVHGTMPFSGIPLATVDDDGTPFSELLLSGPPPASTVDECVDNVVDDSESHLAGIQLESGEPDQADGGQGSTVHHTITLGEIAWKAPDVDETASSSPTEQIVHAAEPAETGENEKPDAPETCIDEGLQPPTFVEELSAPVSAPVTDEPIDPTHTMPLANIPPPSEAEAWSLPHSEDSATPAGSTVIGVESPLSGDSDIPPRPEAEAWSLPHIEDSAAPAGSTVTGVESPLCGDSNDTDISRASEEYAPDANASLDESVAEPPAVTLDSQLAVPDIVGSAGSANPAVDPVPGSAVVGGEERLPGMDALDGDVASIPRVKLESLLATLDDGERNVSARDFVDAMPGSAVIGEDESTDPSEVAGPGGSEPHDAAMEPVWGGTGQVLKEGEEQADLAMTDPLTEQAYQALRLGLKQRVFSETPCALSLVGVESEADIAEAVLQLGILFAKNDDARVLIVDANFTSKILSHRLQGASGSGLCDVLQGSISYANAVLACNTPGLSFLPAGNGGFPRQPSVLRQLPELLLQWKSYFGAIMIDAGGINEQAAKTFVRWCDASCFVLPMNVYTPDEVSAAAEALHQHGARLMGSILTNTARE